MILSIVEYKSNALSTTLGLSINMDVVSLGELIAEFIRVRRGVMHDVADLYMGPFPSGAPAITIDSAARLGLNTGFIGVVGNDDFGRMIISRFRRDGVDAANVIIDDDSITGLAFVAYDQLGSRRFVFNLRWSSSAKLTPNLVNLDYFRELKVLHVSGSTMYIGKGPRDACIKAMNEAKRRGALVSYDPNVRVELMGINDIMELFLNALRLIDVLLINEEEINMLMGGGGALSNSIKLLNKGPEIIVVKRGVNGSFALSKGNQYYEEDAFEVNEVDPTGAGDVFNAAFIYGYLKGWGIDQALKFANAAAAIKVTRLGPMEGPNNVEEVLELMRKGKQRNVK
ncbi:sugar kinase [Caldivirga sp. UBA161]|uniref:sugar kinase n=1 Tax=Caldivirga sp. UBA161 TaxID=1915569 RepID=UPI0025C1FB22|nr:sugar kinase [Caldivirga sp. UBA161]